MAGVVGAGVELLAGLSGSETTHMRWERVATSLARVWAREECGETW